MSGSKNTSIEGIKVIIITFNINLKSGLLTSTILLKYKVRVSLTSSLGWKENNLKSNQAVDPLIFLPKNNTKTSKKTEI